MANKKRIFLASIAVFALAAGYYGYSEYNRKPLDLAKVKPSVTLRAEELIKDFETNEQSANAKYLDKIIAVEGTVKTIEKNDMGYYTVILGEAGTMSSVRCSMDSVHQQDAATLIEGAIVTMKGACTGFNADELLGSDVILNRCVINK